MCLETSAARKRPFAEFQIYTCLRILLEELHGTDPWSVCLSYLFIFDYTFLDLSKSDLD